MAAEPWSHAYKNMDISQGIFTTKQEVTASKLVIINYWGSWQCLPTGVVCNIEWEKKMFPDKDLEGRGRSLFQNTMLTGA